MKLCGLYPSAGACFHYEIMECNGACIDKESPASYNLRVRSAIKSHQFNLDSFLILETGRSIEQTAAVMIRKGRYIGYGYIDSPTDVTDPESIISNIHPFSDNRDVQQIIRNYILQNKEIKILPLAI
jgi:DNA polymerase-3 subunit epsilon